MNNDQKNSGGAGGVGVPGLLQVALIVLKLCGVIKWSWWWVLAPTWGFLVMVGVIIGLAVMRAKLDD